MTAMTCTNVAPRKTSVSPFAWAARALEARRERKALSRLDRAALSDIGLTEGQAHREATRPLWDVPDHWLK
ncbi:DUF1127 domain-containing protein [Aliiroseovarius sp.]|uniref:DUF1127 domain-containing protein n=1 Tax=Aliiroseovarius sp. TaxID=1872442 RepID=UPI003BA92E99